MRLSLLPLFILLSFAFAGCLDASMSDSNETEPDASRFASTLPCVEGKRCQYELMTKSGWWPFITPKVIFGQPAGNRLTVEVEPEDCGPDPPVNFTFRVYDRNGPTFSGAYRPVGPIESTNFTIPFEGEPPFVLAGDMDGCPGYKTVMRDVPFGASVVNAVNLTDWATWLHENYVDVRVPVGAQRGVATTTTGPFEFALHMPYMVNRSGFPFGELRVIDPNGNTIRADHYGWNDTRYRHSPYILEEGEYKVVVDLLAPAVEDTVWTYSVETYSFGPEICELPLAWPMCT